MRFLCPVGRSGFPFSIIFYFASVMPSGADDIVLMAYGGHNETIGPYWVAIDRGLYQKHGIDARLLQVRNAQISLAALVSGEVPIFLPSIANVLSGVSAGAKIACVAFPIKGFRVNWSCEKKSNLWLRCAAKPSACKASAAVFGFKP